MMTSASNAFWFVVPIAATLVFLAVHICTARNVEQNIFLGYQSNEFQIDIFDEAAALVESKSLEDIATTDRLRRDKNAKFKDNSHPTYGHIDSNVTLTPPEFKYKSRMYPIALTPVGNSVKFKCVAKGNPTPNITWYKNGNKGLEILRDYSQPTYRKWSLEFQELTKSDSGNYTCLVCNILGCIDHTVDLNVQDRFPAKPYIMDGYPGNKTVLVDTTVQLSCPTTSDLETILHWTRSTNDSSNENIMGSGYKLVKAQNPDDKPEDLTLYNVTTDDEGWYICVAANTLGNTTAKGYLTVIKPLQKKETLDIGKHMFWIYIGSGLFLVIMLLAIIIILGKINRKKMKENRALESARAVLVTHWTKKVTVEKPHMNGTSNAICEDSIMPVVKIEKTKLAQVHSTRNDPMMSEYELTIDTDWEIPRETLIIANVLGEGEFGKVVKAECVGILHPSVYSVVAVKMLKDDHTDAEMIALVSEMEILKMIGKHDNIINLLGCCTQDGPLYVIVEYARNRNLRSFLRCHRPGNNGGESDTENLKVQKALTQKDLVSFSYQVARGMEYLESKRCIHRDLAARNVLVSDDSVLKIADFGLARDIRSKDYYRKKTGGRLPVRWMAPESLHQNVYTTKSDVWSFGVLLWEIMTLGSTPYSAVPGQHMYQHLNDGHRLQRPCQKYCTLEMYMLMRNCWSFSPDCRPSFTELTKNLMTANQDQETRNSPSCS